MGLQGPSLLRWVRFMLGLVSVVMHANLRLAVEAEFGFVASRLMALLTMTQFHLPFYMSLGSPVVPFTFFLWFWVPL